MGRILAVITGSRADHSHLSPVIDLLGEAAALIQPDGLLGHEAHITSHLG